ncbi:CPBP family intramembrane glutamic endopeptidase [Litoreibacter roseus]|uniref:CAAX prenyl protease 2/Lysostaphin resistance protein A-like domain-containing protein n=1 Tax=Litoreibacter roseus TaxID=2601869 RepID=A0A6N6JED5_9RHOB|nr:CPBP family intramembrane glutamic endopeptidase [Litoreibacter roseus]GFE64484.1 hypothetical protein KIN_15580 [Litoreibacter roseus]
MIRTPAFESFIAPAQRYPQIWRIILGVISALVVYIVFAFVIVYGVGAAVGLEDPMMIFFQLVEPDSPFAMATLLLTFFAMAFGAFAAVAWHWRSPFSLLGRGMSRPFFLMIGLTLFVLLLGGFIVGFIIPTSTTPARDFTPWLISMAWAIPLLFVQITAEELVFRGYLQQQLAARFRSSIIWLLIPSLLFGSAHFNPELGQSTALLIVLATTVFGLIAADLTRITGNLGAAMGLHLANNFIALFIVAIPGELSGLALREADFTMADAHIVHPLVFIDIGLLIIIWLAARRILR